MSTEGPLPIRFSLAVYRGLLKIYPPSFRRRFSRDLAEAFHDSCLARWRADGWVGLARLWMRSLADLTLQGLGERLDGLGRGPRVSSLSRSGGRIMNALRCELRDALRSLLRSPGFTVAIVLILALTIGANTALYSFLNPFLFRPLDFPRSDQLVHLYETDLKRRGELGWDLGRQSGPTYEDWRSRLRSFQDLGAYQYSSVNLSDGGRSPEQFDLAWVTPNLFRLLGVQAERGRLLLPGEDQPGDRRVVLGHSLWQSRYGGDAQIVGKHIDLNGVRHLVVGVMPADFHFPFASVRLWAPLSEDPSRGQRDHNDLLVVGRLGEDATLQSAREELKSVHAALAESHPEAYRQHGVRIVPLKQALIFFYDLFQLLGAVLLGALGAVLLVVCGNVANLFMARSMKGRRELAVRQALGASRGRMMLQTLLQSLLVAMAAAGLGVVLAQWCILSVGSIIPEQLFRVGDVKLDGWTLAAAFLLATTAGLVFGLIPAWKAGSNLSDALMEGVRGTASKRSRRLTRFLVATQTAGAMLLSAGALLGLYALQDFRQLDLGFRPSGLTAVTVHLPQAGYSSTGSVQAFGSRLLERMRALPSVEETAVTNTLPLNFEEHEIAYRLPSQPPDAEPNAFLSRVSEDYFAAMSIPLLQGRGFEAADQSGSPVVVVSAALARRHWPQSNPLGQPILLNPGPRQEQATVVGVVGDAIGGIVFMERRDRLYQLWQRQPQRRFFALVRSQGPEALQAGQVRSLVAELDASVGVSILSMDDLAAQAWRPLKIAALMLSAFAGFALLLAALGMHGLVSYAASLMEKEIAIRMALGAERRRVIRLILRQGLRGVLLGMGVGLLLCAGLVALAAAFDPSQGAPLMVPVAVMVLTLLTALTAVLGPARRALRTDPILALRAE
ncbi:MAG TPA: ADOP family duplicated permease [Acidobacteriota bacterium]|nr:ADOP family duplicated permease [Acidobacteriota bacterium]